MSDHDGYCSGDECILEKTTRYIDMDSQHIPLASPSKLSEWIQAQDSFKNIIKELDSTVNTKGSGYCSTSIESKNVGLDNHDYKILIEEIILLSVIDIIPIHKQVS